MPQFTFANNVNTTLAAAATSSSSTLTLASSNHLPSSIPSGSYLALTLNDAATRSVFEIVYATSVSGSTVTVIRGQEGTTAQNWQVGDYIYASNTAGILSSFAPVEGSTNNPFAVAPASSSAPQNAPQFGQMFQLLTPSATGNITLTALRTIIMPNTTSAITLTMQPGTIVGQKCRILGGAYAVTVASNVSSGIPEFIYPDGSAGYSWTIPAGYYGAWIDLIWDGDWRVSTGGQTVVANAAAGNQALALGQANGLYMPIGETIVNTFNGRNGVVTLAAADVESALGQTGLQSGFGATALAEGNNNTVTATVSFTAPGSGVILAFGVRNNSSSSGVANIGGLYVNGAPAGAENSSSSMTLFAVEYVTAGTVTVSFTAALSIAFSARAGFVWLGNMFYA